MLGPQTRRRRPRRPLGPRPHPRTTARTWAARIAAFRARRAVPGPAASVVEISRPLLASVRQEGPARGRPADFFVPKPARDVAYHHSYRVRPASHRPRTFSGVSWCLRPLLLI